MPTPLKTLVELHYYKLKGVTPILLCFLLRVAFTTNDTAKSCIKVEKKINKL